jgi:uncharacterized membrane protein YqhA
MLKNSQSRLGGVRRKHLRKKVMMVIVVIILVPLIALAIWAAVFDLKRRRRRAPSRVTTSGLRRAGLARTRTLAAAAPALTFDSSPAA